MNGGASTHRVHVAGNGMPRHPTHAAASRVVDRTFRERYRGLRVEAIRHPGVLSITKEINMRQVLTSAVALLALVATTYAGDGVEMKCQAKPEKDPATGKLLKSCGYESLVIFGGGMLFEQATGYCRSCKKFVYLSWTRENIPAEMKDRIKVKPRPKPLGEVWDASTGKTLTIHACPKCNGPFLEIKRLDELKHCPSCNQPGFGIDESKPRMAID